MRILYSFVLILITSNAFAQEVYVRTLHSKLIGKDSVNLYLNTDYRLVEDTCAQIIRYSRYNLKRRFFFGRFKDVSKYDTSVIVAQGSYTTKGKKQGEFVIRNMDGGLYAKGYFINDKYAGKWFFYYPNGNIQMTCDFKDGNFIGKLEYYYESGKPQMVFDIADKCRIINSWTDDGKKIVDKGNGYYSHQVSQDVYWTGKLTNGLPDSTWANQVYGITVGTEHFSKNGFTAGTINAIRWSEVYKDRSRIVFLPLLPELSIFNAELLFPADNCGEKRIRMPREFIKFFD